MSYEIGSGESIGGEVPDYKVGDVVRIIGNESTSYNAVGDIGVVTELLRRTVCRVQVAGKSENCNLSYNFDLELVGPLRAFWYKLKTL